MGIAAAAITRNGSTDGGLPPRFSAAVDSRYSAKQFSKYAGAIAEWAGRGGNVVLTDGAIAALPFLGVGLEASDVSSGVFYAGWMDFNDGAGPTYGRHGLAADVDKEGTAEGSATVDGHRFENRHQTYEPTPLGYYVSPSGAGNSSCDSDLCDSPNWIVRQGAWEDVGESWALAHVLGSKGVPNRVDSWGPEFEHDWSTWWRMLPQYLDEVC